MANAIESLGEFEVRLIKSSGGVFEIVCDGELIYSKKQSGVFPDESQVVLKLKKLIN